MSTTDGASARALQLLVGLLPLLLAFGGCGGTPAAAPVDAEQARRTLVEVLESWRDGENISRWKRHTPAVVVQDIDWQARRPLVDFELLGPGRPQDANLLCPVRLVLREDNSRKFEKEVVYIVGTDPVLTVFRDPFASP